MQQHARQQQQQQQGQVERAGYQYCLVQTLRLQTNKAELAATAQHIPNPHAELRTHRRPTRICWTKHVAVVQH
jgi:hypothetical protein